MTYKLIVLEHIDKTAAYNSKHCQLRHQKYYIVL